ncbi:hypothetical protein PHMEG_00027296 [Phytophthora megakarya]|uniref:Uncharacterized protein n=1 Tax=Phytophthora megakarya TaxID=4795 RepID=A0A225V8X3_9STRA|nr:hypothetical protein PHMEG_00027296 [Phytophthora megakarya]
MIPASPTPAASAGDNTPSPVARTLGLGETIKFMKSGVLSLSPTSPQGCVNIKPTRAVIPPKRGLDAASFVVGVPARAAAYRSDTHVQDGYGVQIVDSQSEEPEHVCLQMASAFRQFESERFVERLFYSVSLLHRVLAPPSVFRIHARLIWDIRSGHVIAFQV